jgi:thiol-disulfide isomerase/thioredoxin
MIAYPSLIFFFGEGCEACAAAEPALDAYLKEHPRLSSLRIKAGGPLEEKFGIEVKATPTYLYRMGAQGTVHEGMLTAAQLTKWIKQADLQLGVE